MTDERDYRKFKRFGSLVNYKRGMYDEITEQPNGGYVSDKDYLDAVDEIDRLRKENDEWEHTNLDTYRDLVTAKEENETLRVQADHEHESYTKLLSDFAKYQSDNEALRAENVKLKGIVDKLMVNFEGEPVEYDNVLLRARVKELEADCLEWSGSSEVDAYVEKEGREKEGE